VLISKLKEKHQEIMKLPALYIETSVFGFYYDKKVENKNKRKATIILFNQIGGKLFRAYYSPVTLAEIQKTHNLNLREKLLNLITHYNIQELKVTSELLKDAEVISTTLIKNHIIPEEKKDDALHFALATLCPEIDYLVTWNCRHIANEITFRRVKVALLSMGYDVKFDVTTPEEVIYYEE